MLFRDRLDDASLQLLRLIHDGSGGGTGDWPVWQWVAGQAAQRGMDAEAVLYGLPEWQLSYGPVRWRARGVALRPEDRLALTAHGLAQVDDAVLLPTFLAALAVASEATASHLTTPQEVRPLILRGAELLSKVRAGAGYRGDERSLHALLAGEPATWSGHTEPGPDRSWFWDLTRVGLQRFAEVRTAEQYLERLEFLVGWPLPAPPAALPLPPLALPEALDHLDAHWRLRTGQAATHRATAGSPTAVWPCSYRGSGCCSPGTPSPSTRGRSSWGPSTSVEIAPRRPSGRWLNLTSTSPASVMACRSSGAPAR